MHLRTPPAFRQARTRRRRPLLRLSLFRRLCCTSCIFSCTERPEITPQAGAGESGGGRKGCRKRAEKSEKGKKEGPESQRTHRLPVTHTQRPSVGHWPRIRQQGLESRRPFTRIVCLTRSRPTITFFFACSSLSSSCTAELMRLSLCMSRSVGRSEDKQRKG